MLQLTNQATANLWYNTNLDADIMVHNGTTWKGYAQVYAMQTIQIQMVLSSLQLEPTTQSDGTPLANNDLWIDTSDLENYPKLYRYTHLLH
jgi:V8-like Glu-specific endopeptidase